MNRRDFIRTAVLSAAALPMAGAFASRPDEIRAFLLHLGHNMWTDYLPDDMGNTVGPKNELIVKDGILDTRLRQRDDLWLKATEHLARRGLNMLVLDLGEGLLFPSHPELAIEGSWTPDRMRSEITRLKAMGVELIPKLNFSTTHNGWMKHYRRMVSTEAYYRMCEDVIRDVAEIFGQPRFFHVGYDEESATHQLRDGYHQYIVVRTKEIWMHDFMHIVRTVEKNGMRPWAWSDYGWDHPEFLTTCPKSVLLSNWFYDESNGGFELAENKTACHKRLKNFYDLDRAGFDQVPCGTNWVGWKRRELGIGADDVIGRLVKVCRRDLNPLHLKGFLMSPWRSLDTPENLEFNLRGIDLAAEAFA